ncbi:MAG: NAD(P)-dependent oxidoreductase [Chloroflexi bacterium]|nr:NAD(P)-dependent oxidoreductase [Chloroflexota bacterium]
MAGQSDPSSDATADTSAPLPRVAFLGLGAMGRPMAANLLEAGHPLTVWNRTASRAEPLTARGATLAASPQAAAADADVVITMLTDVAAVESVAFGNVGLLAGLRAGVAYVDMSTVTPALSLRLAEAAHGRGARFLEAPVLGTIGPAADGTLTILAGGDAETLEALRPILSVMGSTIIHAGPSGQGAWLKLLANALMGVTMQAFFELLAVGQRAGFDRATLAQTFGALPMSSPVMQRKTPPILAGDFAPQFTLDLFNKDLRQLLEAAGALGVDSPMVALAHGLFSQARIRDRGGLDYSVAALAAEERAGITRQG